MSSETCAKCGHDRAFHRVGTGNGVPIGVWYCDDRHRADHEPECRCDGFEDARAPMVFIGKLRAYFNRHGAAGLPWCVAPEVGGWEIAVREVEIGVPSRTVYQPKATPDHEDGRPSAWVACEGRLQITPDGRAQIGPA